MSKPNPRPSAWCLRHRSASIGGFRIPQSAVRGPHSAVPPVCYLTLKSRFGPVVIVWHEHNARPEVIRVFLSSETVNAEQRLKAEFPSAVRQACSGIRNLGRNIQRFLAGEPVIVKLDIAALRCCSGFQQRVLRAEHSIPRGQVMTYSAIAARIGCPGAARAVGNALAHNPFPLIVPCHRAVRANGELGGFQGGPRMKRALLELEEVRFSTSGRVLGLDKRC